MLSTRGTRMRRIGYIIVSAVLVCFIVSCCSGGTCEPECIGGDMACGPDGCGGSCGECEFPYQCYGGRCQWEPCETNEECPRGYVCNQGSCEPVDCRIDDSQTRSTDPDWKLDPAEEPVEGLICPRGDIDHYWFVTTEAGTTIEVELVNKVSMSPVDLCYWIFPQQDEEPPVGHACDKDGLDGITEIHGIHYLHEVGTYFLEVDDWLRDDEDVINRYYISIDLTPGPVCDPPCPQGSECVDLDGMCAPECVMPSGKLACSDDSHCPRGGSCWTDGSCGYAGCNCGDDMDCAGSDICVNEEGTCGLCHPRELYECIDDSDCIAAIDVSRCCALPKPRNATAIQNASCLAEYPHQGNPPVGCEPECTCDVAYPNHHCWPLPNEPLVVTCSRGICTMTPEPGP